MKLPRIYKKSKTGAIVICDISTEGDTIKVTTGQLDGKMQDHLTVCYPMNVGRSNETTAEEQAQKEAKAKHVKKIKSGYVLDPSGEQTVELPMKVKKYQDQKKNIKFPCFASPKLDGVNGLFRDNGGISSSTRGGDKHCPMPHMHKELVEIMKLLDSNALNGEIYKHGMHLQDIMSASTKTNSDTSKLGFHIFEIADSNETYEEKLLRLNAIDNSLFEHVKIVRAIELNSHDEIEKYHLKCVNDGYEGIIIRNKTAIYEYNVRSSEVFKYKLPLDAEYKIVGWRADKKGHPVFTCVTPEEDGALEFKVKIKGTNERRLEIAKEADTWIDTWLKIEFESFSKIKKPLKPVGICQRKCDKKGNPIE